MTRGPMKAFAVIYSGTSVSNARLVAASSDPKVVKACIDAFEDAEYEEDPVFRPLAVARRSALQLVAEALDE